MPYPKSMTTPRRKQAALAVVIGVGVLLIASSGLLPKGATAPTPRPAVSASTVSAPTPVRVGSAAPSATDDLTTFERENAISYPEVTRREIRYGNSLWVYTTLHRQLERAEEICGGYSLYVLVDPRVTVTLVRADDGYGLAKCGPGA